MALKHIPTLQHTVCVKIVSSVFKDCDVRNLFDSRYSSTPMRRLRKFEKEVIENISNIVAAPKLQKLLASCVKPMLFDIINWKKEHTIILSDLALDFALDNALLWHSEGRIDREKTANFLFKNNELGELNRLALACFYCYSDDVLKLWNGMWNSEKDFFATSLRSTIPAVNVWTRWLYKDQRDLAIQNQTWESFREWVLKSSLWYCNMYMLRFFIQNLCTHTGRRLHYLTIALERSCDDDVIRFCASHVDIYQQEAVFRKFSAGILLIFFKWSLQDIFLDLGKRMYSYIDKRDFYWVISHILRKMRSPEWQNEWCIELFQVYWSYAPISYKNYMQNKCLKTTLNAVLHHKFTSPFPTEKIDFVEISNYTDFRLL